MDPSTYGSAFTADVSSGVSNNLWQQGGGCQRDQIRNGYTRGVYFDADYDNVPLSGTQTTEIQGFGGLKWFNSGTLKNRFSSTINSVETAGAFLSIPLDADNGSGTIAQSSQPFFLSGDENTSGKLWLEHRMAFTGILTNGIGWVMGLAETNLFTLATGVPLNGGDALTNSGSFIGFNKLEDGLGVINTVKSDRAAAAPTIIQAGVATLTAAFTFVKMGMFYDPSNATECITFYVNGIKQTTVVSKATLVATTNLKAHSLGFMFASVADSAGTTSESFLDWTKIYQLVP